jgi:hypothetical protein
MHCHYNPVTITPRAYSFLFLFILSGCILDPSPKTTIEQATNIKLCETARIFIPNEGISGTGLDEIKQYFVEFNQKCWNEFSQEVFKTQNAACLNLEMKCRFQNPKNGTTSYVELLPMAAGSTRGEDGNFHPNYFVFINIEWD